MRILVVDDDEILVDLVKQSLSTQFHVVDVCKDGQIAWDYILSGEYELILLDVDLPILDGVNLCKKIRSEGYTTPVLLMTAKDASQDKIRGLDAGADDYLTKPLDLEELNARIRALSRRGEVIPTTILEVNGLVLDPSSCQVSYQKKPIKLTAKEYSLLELFLRNPSRVFSRAQILDRIWTFDDPPLEESVKAHIKGLRKKLKKVGLVDWIENVYGMGYRLNPKVTVTENNDNNEQKVTSLQAEFNRKMEQMWLQYQVKMAERLKVLQSAVNKLKESQLSSDLHQNAERAAHKLAGVLGMFSRDTGTTIAKEIETLLQDNQFLDSLQQEKFISLVTDLESLLALDESLISDLDSKTAKLLLISKDNQLNQELQQLGKSLNIGWYQINNLKSAKSWIQENSPYVVIIDTDIAQQQQEYLSLIAELSARTPTISSVILSSTDELRERIIVARAGASAFLVKPVTPTMVWQTTKQVLESLKSNFASILVVDDDVIFLSALRSMLEPWGFRVTTLEEPLRFWDLLAIDRPNLLILDVDMPEINGIEICQALRNAPQWQDLPILFLTARQDPEIIQQIFEVGGDDYISKPVIGAELLARINNRLERSRLLHNLATQDLITGLPNRLQSTRELETLLLQAELNHQSFCLALLKMPELEQINLKYGHQTGDRILQHWGKVIQAGFRHNEVCGYWGNGDFVIGIPNMDKKSAQEHLAEILTILRKQIFTSIENNQQNIRFQVTCHCSVAQFPNEGKTLHSLYQFCN